MNEIKSLRAKIKDIDDELIELEKKSIYNEVTVNPVSSPKKLLTLNEASEIIGIGRVKLRELTYQKGFPVLMVGSKKLIIMDEITEWLKNHKGETI